MKIGVLGSAGSIGSRHAANLSALGHDVIHFDPAGRMDMSFEREVYDICDAVVIATPSAFHSGGIRAAAERGKHIFVEKPIATGSPEVITDLLALAKKNGAQVMVGCMLRFHQSVIDAKRWLGATAIGKPLWANFTCAQKNNRPAYRRDGVILNWGAHELDLALHLLGPATLASAASTDGDEIADLFLVHDDMTRTTVHLDYVTAPSFRTFVIAGEHGLIAVDLERRSSDLVVGTNRMSASGFASWDDDYMAEMRAFVDRCEGKETRGATGEDGLAVLRLCLDARKMAGLPT
jgi:predicted dehydrogenase